MKPKKLQIQKTQGKILAVVESKRTMYSSGCNKWLSKNSWMVTDTWKQLKAHSDLVDMLVE